MYSFEDNVNPAWTFKNGQRRFLSNTSHSYVIRGVFVLCKSVKVKAIGVLNYNTTPRPGETRHK